jgi:hypothetical protein
MNEECYNLLLSERKDLLRWLNDTHRERSVFVNNIKVFVIEFIKELDRNRIIGTRERANDYIRLRTGTIAFQLEGYLEKLEKSKVYFVDYPPYLKTPQKNGEIIDEKIGYTHEEIKECLESLLQGVKTAGERFLWKDEKQAIEENFEPLQFKNLSQKLLLLESLGVLTALSEKTGVEISSTKMARIIGDLLNEKDVTIKRALIYFNPHSQPKGKNNPRTEKNLTALHQNLVKLGLANLETEVEKQLREVMLRAK